MVNNLQLQDNFWMWTVMDGSVVAKGTICMPQDSYAQQNLVKSGTIYVKIPRRMQLQEYSGTGRPTMTNPAIFFVDG